MRRAYSGTLLLAAVSVAALICTSGSANASGGANISSTILSITASNTYGTTTSYIIPPSDTNSWSNNGGTTGWQSGWQEWALAKTDPSVAIGGDASWFGELNSLDLAIDPDPAVFLDFSLTAPDVDTNYLISSAVVSFAPIINPDGIASAGITLTDTTGTSVSVVGGFSGGKAFQAVTNLGTFAYTPLVNSLTVTFPTISDSESEDTGGFHTIPGAVTSLWSQFSFTVSANALASGTSVFVLVVPEPSSVIAMMIGLVGMSGLVIKKRS